LLDARREWLSEEDTLNALNLVKMAKYVIVAVVLLLLQVIQEP
jgi:hypothetical protein